MNLVDKWVLTLTVACCLGAQDLPDDPVMKARLQRAQAQGIEESDLPPVPRSVVEPPPMPPPEIHFKDAPHPKASKTARQRSAKGQARTGRRAKAAGEAAATAQAKAAPARKKPHVAGARRRKGARRGKA